MPASALLGLPQLFQDHNFITCVLNCKTIAELPQSVKSQEKTKFFQGQGKVSEFCIWPGKFGILLKVREICIILDILRFSLHLWNV